MYHIVLMIVMELVGGHYRSSLGTALQIAFSIGYMVQPVVAYLLRHQFWYQLAVYSPNFLIPFLIV